MKEVKENLPLISIALVATGAIWLTSYYSYFGIDITNYLEFSEIFQLQFIIFFATAAPLTAVISYALSFKGIMESPSTFSSRRKFIKLMSPIINSKWNKALGNKSKKLLRRFGSNPKQHDSHKSFYGKHMAIMILYLSLTGILTLIYKKLPEDTQSHQANKDLVALALYISFIMVFITGLYYKTKLDNSKNLSKFVNMSLLLIIFLIFAGIGINHNRQLAYRIKHNKSKYEVVILLKDKPLGYDTTIVSTNKLIAYVGQTKGYIFLYNRKLKQAHIIPRDQVIDLETTKVEYPDEK